MIDFERFWMESNFPPGYEEEYGPPDPADAEAPPGVTAGEIAAWSGSTARRSPEPLRTALGLRNGGDALQHDDRDRPSPRSCPSMRISGSGPNSTRTRRPTTP